MDPPYPNIFSQGLKVYLSCSRDSGFKSQLKAMFLDVLVTPSVATVEYQLSAFSISFQPRSFLSHIWMPIEVHF